MKAFVEDSAKISQILVIKRFSDFINVAASHFWVENLVDFGFVPRD